MKIKPSYRRMLTLQQRFIACTIGLAAFLVGTCFAAGPYPASAWPPTIDATKKVHYYVVDNAFAAPNANWTNVLSLLSSGDQATTPASCLKGFNGLKGTTTYLNIRDTNWTEWASVDAIDVLMQVYGDAGLLYSGTDQTRTRVVRFQEGSASPTTYTPAGYPTNAFNFKWNWIAWSLTNGWFTNNGIGYHLVGNLKPGSTSPYGGVNGGTIRLVSADGSFNGFTVHAIAIGEAGAFGATNDINVFEVADPVDCPPLPAVNLVGLDFNAGMTNHLEVVSNIDATLELQTSVGPDTDKRKAVIPIASNGTMGYLYNFGIPDNYLGFPCNNNAIFKICVDFYDDPAYAGAFPPVTFGPEAFATDALGCSVSVFPTANLHTLTGSGKWIRRSWTLSNVNLHGVNTSPLTGGPRLISNFGQVAVSRIEMGILRTAGQPLAGQDPLAGCPQDPLVCEGVYTNFVELDLPNGLYNGLDIGTASAEQAFVTEMAGPAEDQRLAVRPDIGPNYYLQFQLVGAPLGPNNQGNSHLAIVLTYWDNPALAGKRFGIDAWHYQLYGADNIYAIGSTRWAVLEGSGKWRDAYWEIDQITFNGVNQAPQAAARFKCEDKVHVSRVRYAVIRTCGPNAGVNLLDNYRVKTLGVAPDLNGELRVSWPYGEPQLTLESTISLDGGWSLFAGPGLGAESDQSIVRFAPTNSTQFFRLYRPPLP